MKFARTLSHPVVREWLIIALVLCGGVWAAIHGQWFYRIDQTLYDRALALWERPPQADIVIVGIDEDSLTQIGRWPWRRAVHATLIDKLTAMGAKTIAFDIILSEPDNRDPVADRLLADAMRTDGHVVLPVVQRISEGAIVGDALPAPIFLPAAQRLGHTSANLDADGILRSVYLYGGFGEPRYAQFALATWMAAEPITAPLSRAVPAASTAWVNNAAWTVEGAPYVIPFAGPPGHYKPRSYIGVLRGDYAPSEFKDKIVLVGMTAGSMGDEFPTPRSGRSSKMAGIEGHANVLQALREGIDIRLAERWQAETACILLVLALLIAYLWLTPRQSIMLTAAAIIAALLGTAILFRYGSFWMSPATAIFAMLLAYPLWSWRKLEATQRYFDDELNRLDREPSVVPREIARSIAPEVERNHFLPDVIEQRIAAVTSATQRMRDLNRFIADSLESLPDAALVVDFDGRVLLANTSADRLFANFILDESMSRTRPLEGRNLFDLLLFMPPADGPAWSSVWASVGADNQPFSQESKAVNEQDFLVQMAPSFSHAGKRTGTIVTLTDISPLRESERRRDEALRFLSHDMRSPQASILTLLEMQREHPDSMTIDKLVERVGKYARRTLNLADDFLRLAKAERLRPQDFSWLNLADLVRDAVEEAWSLASAKGITVKAEVGEAEAWVNGDLDLLARVLINLLSNAIKYSPPDTTVICRLRPLGKEWRIDVADQGYGIAEADMSRLFSRFTRLHTGSQPEEEGIGLGLVFVKTVVQRHGGRIDVTSKVAAFDGDTHGTTFSATLPGGEIPEEN